MTKKQLIELLYSPEYDDLFNLFRSLAEKQRQLRLYPESRFTKAELEKLKEQADKFLK